MVEVVAWGRALSSQYVWHCRFISQHSENTEQETLEAVLKIWQPQCYYRKLAQLLRTARSYYSTSRVLPLFLAFLDCRRENPSTFILSCSPSLTQKLSVALKDILSHSCWANFSFLSQPKALTGGVTWTLASLTFLTLDLADEIVPLGQELLILSHSES